MRRHVMNRWWKRGSTWKGLAATAIGYVCVAVLNGVLHATVLSNNGWWVFSVGMLVIAGLWAWRARGLYIFERRLARAQSGGEADAVASVQHRP